MYDPSIGRWLSVDPLGYDAGDTNLYRYVKNDPVNATDPSGTTLVIEGERLAHSWQILLSERYGVETYRSRLLMFPATDVKNGKYLITVAGVREKGFPPDLLEKVEKLDDGKRGIYFVLRGYTGTYVTGTGNVRPLREMLTWEQRLEIYFINLREYGYWAAFFQEDILPTEEDFAKWRALEKEYEDWKAGREGRAEANARQEAGGGALGVGAAAAAGMVVAEAPPRPAIRPPLARPAPAPRVPPSRPAVPPASYRGPTNLGRMTPGVGISSVALIALATMQQANLERARKLKEELETISRSDAASIYARFIEIMEWRKRNQERAAGIGVFGGDEGGGADFGAEASPLPARPAPEPKVGPEPQPEKREPKTKTDTKEDKKCKCKVDDGPGTPGFYAALEEMYDDVAITKPGLFADKQKVRILRANMAKNGGHLSSDDPQDPFFGDDLVPPNLLEPGSIPRSGAGTRRKLATVDHIVPFTKGGSNSYCNARVISQRWNSMKGNRG